MWKYTNIFNKFYPSPRKNSVTEIFVVTIISYKTWKIVFIRGGRCLPTRKSSVMALLSDWGLELSQWVSYIYIYIYNQVVLVIQTSLTLFTSRYLSLSSIVEGGSFKPHIMFAPDWCTSLLVGHYEHVHVPISIREGRLWVPSCFSSSDLQVSFVLLGLFHDMRGKLPCSCCFVGSCFLDFFRTECNIFVLFISRFFSMHPCDKSIYNGRNPVLFHRIDQTYIWSVSCL